MIGVKETEKPNGKYAEGWRIKIRPLDGGRYQVENTHSGRFTIYPTYGAALEYALTYQRREMFRRKK